MKNAILFLSFIILLVLAFPLSNLYHPPSVKMAETLSDISDPAFQKAASIFQSKCMDCHSAYPRMPFYAGFPIASRLIARDRNRALRAFSLTDKITKGHGEAFTDQDLAQLDEEMVEHEMPPSQYVWMHWDARVSEGDEKAILFWVCQEQNRRQKNNKRTCTDLL